MLLNIISAPALLAFSILANLIGGILRNQYSKKYAVNNADVYFYLLICQITGLVVIVATSSNFNLSAFTLWLAIVFGTTCTVTYLMANKALQTGPMGLFHTLFAASTLIPTFSGAIFWSEKITVPIIAGIVLMALMIILVTKRGDDGRSKQKLFWLYCFFAALSCGMSGIIQKTHQSTSFKDELDSFMIISYAVTALMPLLLMLREKRAAVPMRVSFSLSKAPFWLAVGCGFFSAFPMRINVFLSGVLDSAILFPIVNGGGLLLSVLAAVVVYKEKLTVKQITGIAVGVIAIMLLGGVID